MSRRFDAIVIGAGQAGPSRDPRLAGAGMSVAVIERNLFGGLVDASAPKQITFTGSREELRQRLAQLEAAGATGIIFGTSGYDVERKLRAYAEVAGLR